MKKNDAYNPYGLQEKKPLFQKLTLYATLVAALLGTFLFFPLLQIFRANSLPPFLYYLLYYLSELVSAAALFAVLALGVVSVAREEKALCRRLLHWEAFSFFVLSFVGRLLLYYLSAWLDSKLAISFYFNDETLSYLLASGGYRLLMSALFSFVNVGLTFVMILVAFALVKKAYRAGKKRGVVTDPMKKIPVIAYLVVALLFALLNTILTIADYGISVSPTVILTLVTPYIEIAAFAVLGSLFLTRLVELFEAEA